MVMPRQTEATTRWRAATVVDMKHERVERVGSQGECARAAGMFDMLTEGCALCVKGRGVGSRWADRIR